MARSADDGREHGHAAHAEVEVPAGPEEVWRAIATGAGAAAWMFATEIGTGVGATVVFHREPFSRDAAATVTAWDPPCRFAYEEPIDPGDGSPAVPLATEFLVEARTGGTCVVRVVSTLSHDGEGWEDLIEGAGAGWRMALTVLHSYLTHFAGQRAAHLDVIGRVDRPLGDGAEVYAALMHRLGLTGLKAGDPFRTPHEAPRLAGVVEHTAGDFVLLRAHEPCPALVAMSTLSMDGLTLSVNLSGRLYGRDAAAIAAQERPRWQAWLSDRFPPPAQPAQIQHDDPTSRR